MPGKLKTRSKETNKAGPSSTSIVPAAVSPKSKSKKESKKSKAAAVKAPVEVPETASDEDDEDWEDEEEDVEDDEDDGVDEEGMKKLMKALGEGGLDDVGQMQLDALEGEEEESEEEGSEDEDKEGSEDDEDEDVEEDEISSVKIGKTPVSAEAEDEDDEDQIALEDAESVDEDAVPHQKITLDNKVRTFQLTISLPSLTCVQVALERIRDTIALDSSLPWTETLSVTYPETIEVDVNDDLSRELALCVPPSSSFSVTLT